VHTNDNSNPKRCTPHSPPHKWGGGKVSDGWLTSAAREVWRGAFLCNC